MTIKQETSNGGVGSAPTMPNTPNGRDWLIAGIVAVVIIAITICALV